MIKNVLTNWNIMLSVVKMLLHLAWWGIDAHFIESLTIGQLLLKSYVFLLYYLHWFF